MSLKIFIAWDDEDKEANTCTQNTIHLKAEESYTTQNIIIALYDPILGSCENRARKSNSGLKGIKTSDLCGTGTVLYQLSFQATWEVVNLWVCNTPTDDEDKHEDKQGLQEIDISTWKIIAVMNAI